MIHLIKTPPLTLKDIRLMNKNSDKNKPQKRYKLKLVNQKLNKIKQD